MVITQIKIFMAKDAIERQKAMRAKTSVALCKEATATTNQRVALSDLQNKGKDAFQLCNADLCGSLWKQSIEKSIVPMTAATKLKPTATNNVGDTQMQVHSELEIMEISCNASTDGIGLESGMESKTLLDEKNIALDELLETLHLGINAQPDKPHNSVTTIDVDAAKIGGAQISGVAGGTGFSKERFAEVMVRKHLDGVEDIDTKDKHNLVLVAEYVNDIYDYLYSVEANQCIQKDHLAGQTQVQITMRSKLIDWVHNVHVQFSLTIETFQMAVSIIDLYLQAVKDTDLDSLQLVGITALFIAAKYEELHPPIMVDYVFITDNTYTSQQICFMEQKILKALDFNLSRPVPMHFLRRFSKAARAYEVHHTMAKYLIELTAIQYDLASYKPSEIAAAAVFLTLHLLNDDAKIGTGFNNNHWNKTLRFYSRYSPEHLRPITMKIAAVARYAPQAPLNSVFTKYRKTNLHEISMRFELYSPLMDSIAN